MSITEATQNLERRFHACPQAGSAPSASLVCLILGLMFTLLLAVLTPPFQTPDENQHFLRAYQISEGEIWGEVQHGSAGAELPCSLPATVVHFLGALRPRVRPPIRREPLASTLLQLRVPLALQCREFVPITGAAFYSPLGYLPQAAAMAVGRWVGLGPLGLMYAGRLGNAVAAICILSWALKLLPVGREAALLFGLLPMALAEYASVSPDATIIAGGFLLGAIGIRTQTLGWMSRWHSWVAVVAGAAVCSVKPVYAPFLMVGLPAVWQRGSINWRLLRRSLPILLVPPAITAAWLAASAWLMMRPAHANPPEQIAFIIQHPAEFLLVVVNTIHEFWRYLSYSAIGVLGWLTVWLPPVAYLLPLVGFGICALAEVAENQSTAFFTAWNFLMTLSAVILIIMALYLDSPVGSPAALGIQGRYFLPLLWAPAAAACWILPRCMRRLSQPAVLFGISVIVVVDSVFTILTVVRDFHVL